jgi:PhnB protein
MAQKPAPVPDGYTTVTPWIIVRGASDFIDFLKRVLDAEELGRLNGPDGSILHAELRIGTAIVMVFDTREGWAETHQCLRLYVEDAPAVLERALSAGSRLVTRVTELGFGDRVGRFADPWGNLWWVQERLEVLDLEEMGRRMQLPEYVDAMAYLEQSLDEEMKSRRE